MSELEINNKNTNDLDNCDYLSIKKLTISVDNNINLLFDKLYLYYNQITEIHGLDNLINLQILNLSNNLISEIKGLDNLINLQILDLYNNQITEIKGLENLINLKELYLQDNKIKEIKGLDELVNLQKLDLSYNKITEIKGIDKLINLQILDLSYNQITKIKGLNNLINLQILDLSNNQITEIKGIDNLVNLQQLYLGVNQIIEIKAIDNLVKLQKISLNINKITEIKGINNLVNLQQLNLWNNQITELSISLCNLRNIIDFHYSSNPIEYIPLPVQRWLDRLNNRITSNNMVYNDTQNIHNHNIQNSFRNSLNNIFKDKQLLDLTVIKQQILENNILTEQTKREILNYCDDSIEHTSYLITYSDLLIYVWSRIIVSANADVILSVLNQEISDGLCMCFTGRLTRLLNTLVGFYSDIELQISDSEQITNIIMVLKNKFPSGEELRDAVKKELYERQYSESIINEWIDYI